MVSGSKQAGWNPRAALGLLSIGGVFLEGLQWVGRVSIQLGK